MGPLSPKVTQPMEPEVFTCVESYALPGSHRRLLDQAGKLQLARGQQQLGNHF